MWSPCFTVKLGPTHGYLPMLCFTEICTTCSIDPDQTLHSPRLQGLLVPAQTLASLGNYCPFPKRQLTWNHRMLASLCHRHVIRRIFEHSVSSPSPPTWKTIKGFIAPSPSRDVILAVQQSSAEVCTSPIPPIRGIGSVSNHMRFYELQRSVIELE